MASDLGGSARIPSAFCGIYGFKPTEGRVSSEGLVYIAPTFNGQRNLALTIGPLGKSVEDLNLMMKALASEKFHKEHSKKEHGDMYMPFINWNDDEVHSNRK